MFDGVVLAEGELVGYRQTEMAANCGKLLQSRENSYHLAFLTIKIDSN